MDFVEPDFHVRENAEKKKCRGVKVLIQLTRTCSSEQQRQGVAFGLGVTVLLVLHSSRLGKIPVKGVAQV